MSVFTSVWLHVLMQTSTLWLSPPVKFTSGIIKSQNCYQVHSTEVREVESSSVISFLWCSTYQPLWSLSQWPSQESPNEILKLLLIEAVSGVFPRLERKRERRGKWERELQNNEHDINAKQHGDKHHRSNINNHRLHLQHIYNTENTSARDYSPADLIKSIKSYGCTDTQEAAGLD